MESFHSTLNARLSKKNRFCFYAEETYTCRKTIQLFHFMIQVQEVKGQEGELKDNNEKRFKESTFVL